MKENQFSNLQVTSDDSVKSIELSRVLLSAVKLNQIDLVNWLSQLNEVSPKLAAVFRTN